MDDPTPGGLDTKSIETVTEQPSAGALEGPELFAGYNGMLELFGQYLHNSATNPETRVLFESQVPAMADLYAFLQKYRHDPCGYITFPTGGGKTVMFSEFVKATGLNTLILVPTKLLLEQTYAAFKKFSPTDLAIGKIYGDEKEEGAAITLTTYASFVRHTKDKSANSLIQPGDYELVILDEAHRALAKGTRAALKDYSDVIKIGLTATPNYSERRRLATILPIEIHNMLLREAVQLGLISPLSVVVIQTETDLSAVSVTQSNEYRAAELEKAIDTGARNRLAAEIFVSHLRGHKAVFSCAGVQHSIDMADMLNAYGVRAEAIHGGMDLKLQRAIKQRLALPLEDGGLEAVTNARILTEGFDEPSVSVAFNLAPTLSVVRAQQRSGRVLRKDTARPMKHAVIIEFVDRNYRKPPVIFADPMIAGSAQLAPVNFAGIVDNPLAGVSIDHFSGAQLIADPQEVVTIAKSFANERQARLRKAPRGWQPLYEISQELKEFGVSYEKVRIALVRVKQADPEFAQEHIDKFLTLRNNGEMMVPHYSPSLQQRIAETLGGAVWEHYQNLKLPEESEADPAIEISPGQAVPVKTHFEYMLKRSARHQQAARLVVESLKQPPPE